MSALFVEVLGTSRLQAAMVQLPVQTRKELLKEFRALVKVVQVDARARASWSSRIPGAIGTTATRKGAGLTVKARGAPHARPYEGLGGRSSWRHPVFGNRSVWVSQGTRPYLMPAVDAHVDEANEKAHDAVERAARKVGFFV